MLKTRNLGAYRDLLLLFTKYGRKDFRLSFSTDDILSDETDDSQIEPDVQARAQEFAGHVLYQSGLRQIHALKSPARRALAAKE